MGPRDAKDAVRGVSEKYLEKKLALRRRTKEKYESSLRVHLLSTFGPAPIGRITRDDIQAWIVELSDRGLEPETIRRHYDLMTAIMTRAVDDGLIPRAPSRSMELPQVMRREKRYFTESNVERLVEAVERRYKALVYTAAYLGLGAGDRRPPQASARRQGRKLASMRVVATIERANSW